MVTRYSLWLRLSSRQTSSAWDSRNDCLLQRVQVHLIAGRRITLHTQRGQEIAETLHHQEILWYTLPWPKRGPHGVVAALVEGETSRHHPANQRRAQTALNGHPVAAVEIEQGVIGIEQ